MMKNLASSSNTLYLGSGVTPLVFVEVTPLVIIDASDHQMPSLSAPRVKLLLRQRNLCSAFTKNESTHILRDDMQPTTGTNDSSALISGSLLACRTENDSDPRWVCLQASRQRVPVAYLPSDDPTKVDACPCWMVGYAMQNSFTAEKTIKAIVADSTLVRILPAKSAAFLSESSLPVPSMPDLVLWKTQLTGESYQEPFSKDLLDEILHNHDAETVRALTLRMSLLMTQSIAIGTTADALVLRRKRQHRSCAIERALDSYRANRTIPAANDATHLDGDNEKGERVPPYLREGALLVQSPNHGAGKTMLVQAIAQVNLKCKAVHVIQPGALLAQYTFHADTALESLLHAIVMSAACRQESICIILDHLDAMLPPKMSGRTSSGDAAVPVLNAIGEFCDRWWSLVLLASFSLSSV